MRISVIQTGLEWENVKGNLEKIEKIAEPLSTDLVILPEMFSTGFSMNISLAEEFKGLTFRWLSELSKKGDFAVCGSYMVNDNGAIYNRFVFVSPEDDVYFYDKRHLFSIGEEDRHFTKGSSRLVFQYKTFRISPYICYDLRFPVWSRNKDEYDLAIYVSSWPQSRINVWNTLLGARAIENQCYVAGSNRTGIDGNGISHNGMSQILNPRGEIIAAAGTTETNIISADLSLKELSDFRMKFNVLNDGDDFVIRP
jgi:predicted amidohydrolase